MRMCRREFMGTAAAATLGWSVPWFAHGNTHATLIDQIGLQLFTLRQELGSDPMGTLQALQQAGYKQVELMDVMLLPRLKPVLQSMELSVNSSHFSSPYITGNWEPLSAFGISTPAEKDFKKVLDLAVKHELRFLVFPFLFPEDRGGISAYQQLADKLNTAGEKCREAGIQLCYHLHAFEFQPMENTSPFQVLYQTFVPELVKFEVDVFWLSLAGLDPAAFLQEYGKSICLLHLKDLKAGVQPTYKAVSLAANSYQPVGAGVLDFKAILQAAKDTAIAHAFVEQDESAAPLQDIRRSIQYLQQLKL